MPWTPTVSDGSKVFIKISTAWQEVRGAKNFQLPQPSVAEIDIGELRDSVSKFTTGKVDFGTATFELMLDSTDSVHAHILSNGVTAGNVSKMYVEFSGGAQFVTVNGSLIAPQVSFEKDQPVLGSVGFRISGAPVYSATTPTP